MSNSATTYWVLMAGAVIAVGVFLLVQLKLFKPKQKYVWNIPGKTASEPSARSAKTDAAAKTQEGKKVEVVGRFPAVVFSSEKGITFEKIPERVGMTHYMDPSIPERGPHFMVVKSAGDNGETKFEVYDPRHAPMLSNKSPQFAYRSIVWDSMKRVYAYRFGMWDNFNKVLAGIGLIGMFFVILTLIDSLGKH